MNYMQKRAALNKIATLKKAAAAVLLVKLAADDKPELKQSLMSTPALYGGAGGLALGGLAGALLGDEKNMLRNALLGALGTGAAAYGAGVGYDQLYGEKPKNAYIYSGLQGSSTPLSDWEPDTWFSWPGISDVPREGRIREGRINQIPSLPAGEIIAPPINDADSYALNTPTPAAGPEDPPSSPRQMHSILGQPSNSGKQEGVQKTTTPQSSSPRAPESSRRGLFGRRRARNR